MAAGSVGGGGGGGGKKASKLELGRIGEQRSVVVARKRVPQTHETVVESMKKSPSVKTGKKSPKQIHVLTGLGAQKAIKGMEVMGAKDGDTDDVAMAANREKWIALSKNPNLSMEMIAESLTLQDLAPQFRGIDMEEFDRKWDIAWQNVQRAEEALQLLDGVEDSLESMHSALVSSFDAQMQVAGLSDVEKDRRNQKWIKRSNSFVTDYETFMGEHTKLLSKAERALKDSNKLMETGKGEIKAFDKKQYVDFSTRVEKFKALVVSHLTTAPSSRNFVDEEDEDEDAFDENALEHDNDDDGDDGAAAFFGEQMAQEAAEARTLLDQLLDTDETGTKIGKLTQGLARDLKQGKLDRIVVDVQEASASYHDGEQHQETHAGDLPETLQPKKKTKNNNNKSAGRKVKTKTIKD